MKRTGFKRPARPERVKTPLGLGGACTGTYSATGELAPQPKHDYVRSPALLAAVRTLPCMLTGLVGQTEPAHSNWAIHGKGKSVKADDNRVAAIAHFMHADLDQGSRLSREDRQAMWFAAHQRTVSALLERDLWPAGVPVPDITTNPFTTPAEEATT